MVDIIIYTPSTYYTYDNMPLVNIQCYIYTRTHLYNTSKNVPICTTVVPSS